MSRSDFSLKNVLYFVPLVVAIIYVWISLTPTIHNMGIDLSGNIFWEGLDGWYDFFLTNTVLGWMENLDQVEFLLVLPLAIIELACLIIGIVLDLVMSFILIILGFLWAIILLILDFVGIFIIPAAAALFGVYLLVTIDRDQHILLIIFSTISCVISVIGIILYYITLKFNGSSGGVDIIAALIKHKKPFLDLMNTIFFFNMIVALCCYKGIKNAAYNRFEAHSIDEIRT